MMKAIALITILATIMNVDGNHARIDAGLIAGVRPGDIGLIYYLEPVGSAKKRVVVNRGEVVEINEFTATLAVESEFSIRPGYSVEFEVPQDRVAPLGIFDLARSRLAERSDREDIRPLIEQMIPEDIFVEEQVLKVLEERRQRRQRAPMSQTTSLPQAPPPEVRIEGQHDELEMLADVQSWAQAWSDQKVDDYLQFYSQSFTPQGLSRSRWEAQRRQRITRPQFITLSLVFLESHTLGVDRGWVRFRQDYRSNTFSDSVIKKLELVWENDGWKIVRELVEG